MWPQVDILRNPKLRQILALLIPQGFILTINGVAAPWIVTSFRLTPPQVAQLFAWVALSGIGALILTRLFDVVGRGRVLWWSMLIGPLSAMGAALTRSVIAFTVFEIALHAAAGAVIAGAPVVIAESLEPVERATGQSWGGIALGAGAGLCILMMPLLLHFALSWRLLLWTAALPIVAAPRLMTRSWQNQFWHPTEYRKSADGSLVDLMRPPHRRRAMTFMISNIFSAVAIATSKTWSYFHCVSSVGITPAAASGILIVAGGIALAGFPVGAALCERLGRVGTVTIFALVVALSVAFTFWGPPRGFAHPVIWLLLGFSILGLAVNATTVGGTASATELFPVTLRATAAGWIAVAGTIGRVAGQGLVAAFAARLGGISNIVGLLGFAAIAISVLFWLYVDESRGLVLEPGAVSSV